MTEALALADGVEADLHRAILSGPNVKRALTARQCQILHWAERGATLVRTAEALGLTQAELSVHLNPLLADGLARLIPGTPAPPDMLTSLWTDAVQAFGFRPWLIPSDDAPSLTFAEAAERVDVLARHLTAAGLTRGDRLLAHAAPSVDAALLFWACTRLGIIYAPVDSAAPADAVRRALDLAQPALVYADTPRAGAFNAGGIPVMVLGTPVLPPDTDLPPPPDEDDIAVILFTSGTTGEPKGVELSQGALTRSARLLAGSYGLNPMDRLLSLGEFHTMSGLRNPLIVTVAAGAACVLAGEGERRHPIGAIDLCQRRGVTVLSAVPAFLKMLSGMAARLEPGAFGPLRLILSTAADLSPELSAAIRSITGAPVLNYYGLTETCGACTLVAPADADRAQDSIGTPAGAVCQIVAEDGRILADDEAGELLVHSANLMAGYHRRPDLTATMLRDGWLYTGDLAVRRPDGHIVLVGRRRDIIKTARGDLLALGAVERLLEEDPAVEEAAVCGTRDARGDERLTVFVRLTANADAAQTIPRLKVRLAEQLGPRTAPRDLHVLADFPRGANGKVLKHKLTEDFLSDDGF
ncbi:class I adenylate-forming enzyme family protein [Azospirillum soli]|uniref:class I adenylate-forming enzyme family protein n=1 Tax=Azospirillum soli TaxID=1304799 RepID=UPI001AE89786|nr:class I adenylate-forming enzyme family protein [Azospirillum soli]MBP2312893.1 acyl-coenzyme A synthetase/AMP-(fatty) acid ligase [Azospirillum soli]